jgi:Asp-tRNA(Asn)/Glu-tRNA(Gln) amidotransferase A subunit family amidase
VHSSCLQAQVKDWLDTSKTSSVELVEASLILIQDKKHLNAYTSLVNTQQLLEQAETYDKQRKEGSNLTLGGIPVAIKDIFNVKGTVTSCSSKMLSSMCLFSQADERLCFPVHGHRMRKIRTEWCYYLR